MADQVIITVAKRTVLKYHRIWSEYVLEETGLECVQLHDSISQEELRRLTDMGIIDQEGFITKRWPLPRIFIRPRSSC